MTTILLLGYLFIGLIVYAVTDVRSVAGEIGSRNLLLTFGDVNKFLTIFAIALWPVWLALYAGLKKR
jgi:hypothetical protein